MDGKERFPPDHRFLLVMTATTRARASAFSPLNKPEAGC
jgi:hypothetical protein